MLSLIQIRMFENCSNRNNQSILFQPLKTLNFFLSIDLDAHEWHRKIFRFIKKEGKDQYNNCRAIII